MPQTEPPGKELAKTPKSLIRDVLQGEEFKRQIARALPRTMSPERFARIALTATYKNPKLLNCTRESLLQCLMELSAIGLEPDGRRAHLIPFKDQCTLIIDYKGIAELIRRNGVAPRCASLGCWRRTSRIGRWCRASIIECRSSY